MNKKVNQSNNAQDLTDSQDEFQNVDEIRERSKTWTPEMWEQYLVTLESPVKEDLIAPSQFDRLAQSCVVQVFDYAQGASSPSTTVRVQSALDHLTQRQRQVVGLIFFKSMTSREVARKLGICQSAVCKFKRKGLRNLRQILEEGVVTLPLVEGPEIRGGDDNG